VKLHLRVRSEKLVREAHAEMRGESSLALHQLGGFCYSQGPDGSGQGLAVIRKGCCGFTCPDSGLKQNLR
jgi:hypothetical protein